MLSFAFLLVAQVIASASSPVDPARVEAEIAADADVLRSLQENGDDPTIARAVDVRFTGTRKNIVALQRAIDAIGWRVVQMVRVEGDTYALDVQRKQFTDPASIRSLTEAALLIGQRFSVSYDGWGTVAIKR